jgi:hypothetical protein
MFYLKSHPAAAADLAKPLLKATNVLQSVAGWLSARIEKKLVHIDFNFRLVVIICRSYSFPLEAHFTSTFSMASELLWLTNCYSHTKR